MVIVLLDYDEDDKDEKWFDIIRCKDCDSRLMFTYDDLQVLPICRYDEDYNINNYVVDRLFIQCPECQNCNKIKNGYLLDKKKDSINGIVGIVGRVYDDKGVWTNYIINYGTKVGYGIGDVDVRYEIHLEQVRRCFFHYDNCDIGKYLTVDDKEKILKNKPSPENVRFDRRILDWVE